MVLEVIFMDQEHHLLTNEEAASYLRLRPQTLRVWRYKRKGPQFLKIGNKVCYRRDDLDRWLESRVRPRSGRGTANG